MIGKTLLIGGCGYIGSRLFQFLEAHDVAVTTVDLEWFGNVVNSSNLRCDYVNCVDREFLEPFTNVILLAGHSNARMCEDRLGGFKNNVLNFVVLLEALGNKRFLYASSASVYGHTGGHDLAEKDLRFLPRSAYDLTKYEIDCHASLSGIDYYALRFGTVCGYSPNLRTDLILNQMFLSAQESGMVEVVNPAARRAVLGIEDLCGAVWAILRSGSRPGTYNVASFNLSVAEAASAVCRRTGAELVVQPANQQASLYDFRVDTTKFQKSFDYRFADNIDSILDSLGSSAPLRAHRTFHDYP